MWNKKLPFNNKNIKYLWCCSKYPTFDDDLKNFPKMMIKNITVIAIIQSESKLVC